MSVLSKQMAGYNNQKERPMAKVLIDGIEYEIDNMSAQAKNTLASVRFVDQQIQLKSHELNIAKTAQAAYAAALKRELSALSPASSNKEVD
jgi:hypothetical protein